MTILLAVSLTACQVEPTTIDDSSVTILVDDNHFITFLGDDTLTIYCVYGGVKSPTLKLKEGQCFKSGKVYWFDIQEFVNKFGYNSDRVQQAIERQNEAKRATVDHTRVQQEIHTIR